MFTRNILKTDFAMIAGLVMFVATSFAGDFRVTADAGDVARVERVGPPTQYMPHLDRYSEQVPDAYHYPIPQEKITRETYLKWIEDSGHLSYAEGDAPTKHGQYGPRHFTPVLAKYVQTKDPKLADAMIRMLKAYDQWIRDEVKRSGWHSQFIDEPAYLGLYRKYLSEGGALDLQKDQWFRDLILYHTKTLHVWGTPQTYWRGPMHRAQGEGIAKGLAALWYPDAPDAAEWKKYADAVYQDWWKYKDVPPNDTGYIFGIFVPLFVGAYLRGDDTFFTDPEARKVWDRMLYEITPDGAIIPYGAHGGWNSTAGTRIFMLELLAAKTKDGRYRFGAHKLMNYLLYQQEPYKKHHILLGPETTEKIALAYLLADDSIQPVQPDAGSKILYRKETLRLRNKEAAEKWLGPLDPDPARNQICCSLIVTDKTVPAKLVLRSGWNPGDFFALVDIFPRHDPLNTPGILGMTRWGSVLGLAMNAKGSSEEGRLIVEDLGGTAPLRRNTDPDLADPYYQDVKIDAFVDMKKATFATVTVKDYAGFPVTYTRSFAFIKNRFLVARDVARFEEGFLARIASAYNSQNIGPQVGDHWANTYFSGPRSSTQTVKNPPYDLLVYFSPQPERTMKVIDRTAVDPRAIDVSAQVRYEWRGVAKAGRELLFTQVYYPHAPNMKLQASNAPGAARVGDLVGTAGADGITVLQDDLKGTVIRFTFDQDHEEWVVFNPAGSELSQGTLTTNAKFAYVDSVKGEVKSVCAREATFLSVGGKEVFRQAESKNYER